MTDREVEIFIEEMGHLGDLWDEEQVKRIYGDKSLEDALDERKKLIGMQMGNLLAGLQG